MGESCRSGETCKYGRWAWTRATKWPPKHEARGCLQYHVHTGLSTEEDTRHRFHGVANLTNVMSCDVMRCHVMLTHLLLSQPVAAGVGFSHFINHLVEREGVPWCHQLHLPQWFALCCSFEDGSGHVGPPQVGLLQVPALNLDPLHWRAPPDCCLYCFQYIRVCHILSHHLLLLLHVVKELWRTWGTYRGGIQVRTTDTHWHEQGNLIGREQKSWTTGLASAEPKVRTPL